MRARIVVQVVAVVAGAAFTVLAGWNYSDASSAWQKAIREEVDKAGVLQDEVRQVYANEGPFAFRVTALQVRADTLAPLGEKARTERTIAENAAYSLRKASGPTTLLGQRRYDLPGGGSDLVRRLADITAQREKPLPDPNVPGREGDGLARLAFWISVLTAIVTGLAVLWASLRGLGRGPVLELYPQPGTADDQERRFAFLALAIWAASVLFPLVQLYFSSQEQQHQAQSARHAVQARSAESISSTRTEFLATARQIAAEVGVAASAREIDANYSDPQTVADTRELARAEDLAGTRSSAVANAMARAPVPADGVEAGLATALTSRQHDWDVQKALSDWEAKTADTYGAVSNTMLGILGFVVLAQAQVQAATERRRTQAERPPSRRTRCLDGRAFSLACLGLVVAVVLWLSRRRTTCRGWRAAPGRGPGRRPGT